jgi:flagellar FliL protein
MAEAEKEEALTAPKPRFGTKWIIIGVAVIVVVAGGATFGILKYLRSAGTAVAAKVKKESVESTLNLDPFLVNLADKEATRFVKVTFRLGLSLDEKEVEEKLSKNNVFLAQTRDAVISLLTSKTSEEVLTPDGKEKLRQEVQTRVNAFLSKGKVMEVYIVDFVVQL